MSWISFAIGFVIAQVILLLFGDEIGSAYFRFDDWWSQKKRNWRWPWQVERRRKAR
jgi:hypothetical protein